VRDEADVAEVIELFRLNYARCAPIIQLPNYPTTQFIVIAYS
jgi:hypothetical protein